MASRHTERFGLDLWEPGDSVLREEFNENFAKLDTAFGPVNLPWVTGTYTGDADEDGGEQHITLGFRPTLLVVLGGGKFGLGVSHEGAGQGVCSYFWEGSHGSVSVSGELLEVTDDGFTARRRSAYQNYTVNHIGVQYLYFALR